MLDKQVILDSERLHLRPLKQGDCNETYLQWLEDENINQYLETRWSKQTIDAIWQFVESVNQSQHSFLFAIEDKATKTHIGNIKLGPINPNHGYADISYFIGDRDSWGKGFATEAIQTVTEFGFKELKLEMIQAGVYSSNVGSAKALLKSGYEEQGRLKNKFNTVHGGREDHIWYVINKK